MSSTPELSIIIPAVNEERRLPETLEKIHRYLAAGKLSPEVLVVDHGSTHPAPPLRDGKSDGAIGSRNIDRSLIESRQSLIREAGGFLFNRVVRFFTGLPFSDTQCGFKAFRLERARLLFEQQRIVGFGFDPEILFLAARHGLRIAEIPVRWAHDPGSKVKFIKDGLIMVGDLC